MYSKRNKLKRIIDIQELYQRHKLPGVSLTYVYTNYIKPVYHISKRTMEEYLATPAVKLLKELDNEPQNKAAFKQLSMGFAKQPGESHT